MITPIKPPIPASVLTRAPWLGRAETTDAKMISDIPFPMPFWLINSPIHIKRAVPAVSVNTTRATRGAVNFGSRSN